MNGKVKHQQPLWRSLIWARIKIIPQMLILFPIGILIPLGTSIATAGDVPTSSVVASGLFTATILFGTCVAALSLLGHAGTLTIQARSGASRRRLEISSWAVEGIFSLSAVLLWIAIHALVPLLPWSIDLPSNAQPQELVLLTVIVFFGGACGRVAGMIMRQINLVLGGLIAIHVIVILVGLASTTLYFPKPGVSAYMKFGIPLWAQILPMVAFIAFTYWQGTRVQIRPFHR